jgi:tetratricopeptide (TPR) repeat protein
MHKKLLIISLSLISLTVAVYWPVTGNQFVAYDDQLYVTLNPHVAGGLSRDGLIWAITTFDVANWHPVTWLSHQLDVTLFGIEPGAHHAVNLLLHSVNILLLLLLVFRLTGSLWPSALVTALFALHPLRVESVAWIAERKDLLCASFFFMTLHAYVSYTVKPCRFKLALVSLLFALSLMAKPMSVTLPFVLLLLDWWPLRRFDVLPTRSILLEKVPLMMLSVASCIVTVCAQKWGGAVIAVVKMSMYERLVNALSSYALYLWKTIWPFDLAVLYPLPSEPPLWKAALGVMIIAVTTTAAVRLRGTRPYLLMGWLWYLGMLVPVIGLVQVGIQSHADRYTYLPMIGCYIAVAWWGYDLTSEMKKGRAALFILAVCILITCALRSRQQVYVWRDGETLFRHALSVTDNNYVMHTNLGIALWDSNRAEEAITEFRKGIAICPEYADQHFILGNALLVYGDALEAAEEYRTVLRLVPGYPHAHTNLGMALHKAGQIKEAADSFREGLKRDPDDYKARENLRIILDGQRLNE